MAYYNKLKIKDFLNIHINQPNLTEEIIIDALESCYNNCAFSTFPYIIHKLNSREAIDKFKSGNCVALSIYLQEYLKNGFNIDSYLIPATIPKKYQFEGYLNISHVVLAIPKNNKEIFIADPAFYFLNPIKVNLSNFKPSNVFSKEIYTEEISDNLKDYNSIQLIIANTKKLNGDIILNEYQKIPKNTIISEVYYENDPEDKWVYYLKEILNPDEAVTEFFIGIRSEPFIMTTIIDSNGISKGNGFFSLSKYGRVKISEKDKDRNYYNIDNIPKNKLNTVREFTKPYFKNNLDDYLNIYKYN